MDIAERRLQRIRKLELEKRELERRISLYKDAIKEIHDEREAAWLNQFNNGDFAVYEAGLLKAYQILLKYEKM